MEIPVYENETLMGTLLVSVQGLYTVFETRLPATAVGTTIGRPFFGGGAVSTAEQCSALRQQANNSELRLTRLWLLGGEQAVSLGLLEPRGGERRFRRSLTRLELQKLPPQPWTALMLPDGESPTEQSLPRTRGRCPAAPIRDRRHTGADEVSFGMEREGEDEPRCARGPHQSPPATASPCAGKPNTPTAASPSPWRRLADGSLYDPERRLLALPWAGGEPPAPARKIWVNGRDYLLFHT